jgi:glucose-6-phosphate 1-epimerase
MPAIRWWNREGACAIATLQGAHLVSWTPPGGEECLYLSERSPFETGRAIRGGIPVVFPQFADRGALAQHGFARNRDWVFVEFKETQAGAHATFALQGSAEVLALWPWPFRLELVATLAGATLDVQLRVVNTGGSSFRFTAALHTYLRVNESSGLRLHGLRGVRYVERGTSHVQVQAGESITPDVAIDRVYFAPPPLTRVEDAGRVIEISQRNFTDTVVWNPGRERTAAMADMPAEGYRRMLCVEAAAIDPGVTLDSGASWTAGQRIAVSSR